MTVKVLIIKPLSINYNFGFDIFHILSSSYEGVLHLVAVR